MKLTRNLLPCLAVLCMAMGAFADTTWTGAGADSNWATAANWDDGVPVANDFVRIQNGDSVTLGVAGAGGRLNLTGGSDLTVSGGGSLALDGVGQSATVEIRGGNLNVFGGSVAASGDPKNDFVRDGGSINITAGSVTRTNGSIRYGDGGTVGTLDVSGTGSSSGGNMVIAGTGIVNLTGSDASIGANRLFHNAGTNLTFNLTPGSAGINPIAFGSVMDLAGNSTLNVDLSAYDVANGDLTIFTYGTSLTNSAGTDIFNTLNITGGSAVIQDDGAGNVILTNISAVPEPAAATLLGLFGFGMLVRRRK